MVILCAEETETLLFDEPAVVIGVGSSNVIRTISNLLLNNRIDKTTPILNIGLAGSTKYPVGSIISVNKCIRQHNQFDKLEYELDAITDIADTCITADSFLEDGSDIPLVDMELYYLLSFGLNVKAIKVVSDNLNFNDYSVFNHQAVREELNSIISRIS